MVTAALIFASPLWLLAAPVLMIGALFFWRLSRRRAEQRIGRFLTPSLAREAISPAAWRQRAWRFAIVPACLALLAVAAARPLVGPRPGHAERKGVDFVVALDVSKSMWAEDVPPNRLEAVRKSLIDWLHQAAGDRMGVVVFAGEAVIQAPITFDYQALERVLKAASPQSISKGGTNIPAAIDMAKTLLNKSGLDTRALVIFSDGENLDGDAIEAARQARAVDGISIFTVGVGTKTGDKVPLQDRLSYEKSRENQPRPRAYTRNEYGTEVVTRLDEQALRLIASAGGGKYTTFNTDPDFLQKLRDTLLLPLAKSRKILNVQDYYEWFPIPLALALLVLMAEPLIPFLRRQTSERATGVAVIRPETLARPAGAPVTFSPKRAAKPASLALFLVLAASAWANATELGQQVRDLLAGRKADEAIALVKKELDASPADPTLLYNYGLTLYQAGRFEEAIAVFQDVKTAARDDDALRERALFQLGNAQFHLAESLKDKAAAVLSMERSLSYYDELLALKPSSPTRRNETAAKEALETYLRAIAAERLKTADEQIKKNDTVRLSRTLQDAVEALEKLASLTPEDRPTQRLLEETRQRLADSLMADAAKRAADADQVEAKNNPNDDRKTLGTRNQAIDIMKQAQTQAPKDARIPQAIQDQQTKMSNLITKRAEEKVAPALAKEKTDFDALTRGRRELAQATELDAHNQKAADLKKAVDQRLESEYLRSGQKALANAEKSTEARNKLGAATMASEAFQKTQEINPDNQAAADGLKKVNEMLPSLHAQVAALDKAEAQKLLDAKPNEDGLKKAVGYLETSTQNYARALDMKPGDQKIQQDLADAQKLLSQSRDQLDAERQSQPSAQADQSASPSDSAQNGSGTSAVANSKTQLYAPKQNSSSPGVTSSLWSKAKEDW